MSPISIVDCSSSISLLDNNAPSPSLIVLRLNSFIYANTAKGIESILTIVAEDVDLTLASEIDPPAGTWGITNW